MNAGFIISLLACLLMLTAPILLVHHLDEKEASTLLRWITSREASQIAIVFLSHAYDASLEMKCSTITKRGQFDCFIVVDDCRSLDNHSGNYSLCLSDRLCVHNGFTGTSYTVYETSGLMKRAFKSAFAWDKALFAFSLAAENAVGWEAVFFIESDVFIPSYEALTRVAGNWSARNDDLFIASHHSVGRGSTWVHWRSAVGRFQEPWFHSMACAAGVSSRLLRRVKQIAETEQPRPSTCVCHSSRCFCLRPRIKQATEFARRMNSRR